MLVEEIWEEGRCVLVGERFGKREGVCWWGRFGRREGVCWWGDLGGEEEGRVHVGRPVPPSISAIA